MDDPARIVAAGYDSVADRHAALEPDDGAWPRSPHVAAFTRLLPPGASVLDIGCGNGVPVARSLAAAGFAVTGVDVSEEQVRRAREAVPRGSFLVGDVRAVVLPESAFDAALCIYSLDHVPHDDHPEVYERIAQWLRPGGHVLVAIEDADVPGVVHEWLGAPSYFSSYAASEERRLVELAGLEVLDADVEAQVEQGVEVPYLWLVARRPIDQQN